jgi:hypothetical protein
MAQPDNVFFPAGQAWAASQQNIGSTGDSGRAWAESLQVLVKA